MPKNPHRAGPRTRWDETDPSTPLRSSFSLGCAALLVFANGCTSAKPNPQLSATPGATVSGKTSPPAPMTFTVTRSASKSKPQFDAVFEAIQMTALKVEVKAWTDLTVLEVVPHGARVKKGDILVKLDIEKLKEQVDDLEREQPAAKLAYELAAADLDNGEQTTPLRLELARRNKRLADEDLAYFEKTGRPAREKSAQFGIKSADQRLDGAKEELRQLEKMYKADDLVEDTEEIILRRQRFALEAAQYGLELANENSTYNLKTGIPREAETLKSAKRDQDLALALAEQNLPRNLAKKRLDFEKLKREQKKNEKRLVELKLDLDNLAGIRSPMDGIVYYGACEGGKWTTGPVVMKKLFPSGKLTPNEVFMTIANPQRLRLKAVVPEADLGQLTLGMEGKAAPLSAPDKKLSVKLEELGAIPLPTGGFEASLSVVADSTLRLMPGMNCKISLGEPTPPEPLRAPKAAVFADEGERWVFVLKNEKQHEKRKVKTGASAGKMVEILEGLSEGEIILLNKPK